MPLDNHRLTNRANWDSRVDIHHGSDVYGIGRFIDRPGAAPAHVVRPGDSSLI